MGLLRAILFLSVRGGDLQSKGISDFSRCFTSPGISIVTTRGELESWVSPAFGV